MLPLPKRRSRWTLLHPMNPFLGPRAVPKPNTVLSVLSSVEIVMS